MSRKIKIVIWDLDDTFWSGTLSETGIEWNEAHAAVVRELCARGIVSSICSKNDPGQVQEVLAGHSMDEFFVFPSIGWNPKGEAIRQLLQNAQLRAENALFIDDNPMNREEALFANPGLHCAGPEAIGGLLEDPGLKGKDDRELTRLSQYKVLERKQSFVRETGFDNTAFLRQSGIRVRVDHDVEAHLDRIIELANRSNQLNYTKIRFSEEPATARAELCAQIAEPNAQSACVFVKDNYGDYGLVGFYLIKTGNLRTNLKHFVFSCRILNMGVEQWLYQVLGRPRLKVAKPVATALAPDIPIDWINTGDTLKGGAANRIQRPRIVLRGACDMVALSHYLRFDYDVVEQVNFDRDGHSIRYDQFDFLFSLDVYREHSAEIRKLGVYTDEDLSVDFFDGAAAAYIYSSMMEWRMQRYRHRKLGFVLPFTRKTLALLKRDAGRAAMLASDYQRIGDIDDEQFVAMIRRIRANIAAEKPVFFVLANDRVLPEHQEESLRELNARHNALVRQAVADRPNVFFIDFSSLVTEQRHVTDGINHFDRSIYWQAATGIKRILERGNA
jgi:FkbH-like protein